MSLLFKKLFCRCTSENIDTIEKAVKKIDTAVEESKKESARLKVWFDNGFFEQIRNGEKENICD